MKKRSTHTNASGKHQDQNQAKNGRTRMQQASPFPRGNVAGQRRRRKAMQRKQDVRKAPRLHRSNLHRSTAIPAPAFSNILFVETYYAIQCSTPHHSTFHRPCFLFSLSPPRLLSFPPRHSPILISAVSPCTALAAHLGRTAQWDRSTQQLRR